MYSYIYIYIYIERERERDYTSTVGDPHRARISRRARTCAPARAQTQDEKGFQILV